jgi:hypothetical protein
MARALNFPRAECQRISARGSHENSFEPHHHRAHPGSIYYYAVTAVDDAGNKNDLSRDGEYDIPRPEGYDVVLASFQATRGAAGYDFSTYAVVA